MLHETIVTLAPISDPDSPFFVAFEQAIERLAEAGLVLEHDEALPTAGYDLLSFVHREQRARIDVWEDYQAKVKYIDLSAPNADLIAAMRDALLATLRPPTAEQLIARARRSRSDPTALMRAVYAAAANHGERAVELITAALNHRHPSMRAIAAYAAGVLGGEAIKRAVEQSLKGERDEHAARAMRHTLQRAGIPQRPRVP